MAKCRQVVHMRRVSLVHTRRIYRCGPRLRRKELEACKESYPFHAKCEERVW